MSLILTRKPGESIYIGDDIIVTVNEIKGNQIRLAISAPAGIRIYREEIYLQIREENKMAAETARAPEFGLDKLGEAWRSRVPEGSPSKLTSKLGISPMSGRKQVDPIVTHKRKKRSDNE